MTSSFRIVPRLITRAVKSVSYPTILPKSLPNMTPSITSLSPLASVSMTRSFNSNTPSPTATVSWESGVGSKDPDARLLRDLEKLTEEDSAVGGVRDRETSVSSTTASVKNTLGTASRIPEFSLDGKVVAITGGVGGVGIQMAEAILEAGSRAVIALDRLPEPRLPKEYYKLADRAEKELGGYLGYHQVDVTSENDVHSTIDKIVDQYGRIDGLIAAAGINKEIPALQHSAKDFNLILDINVTGCFLAAQAVAKHMVKDGKGGSIVLIASMSGTIANKDLICPAYNASKAAVLQLGRSLAMEWGAHKIRVNTISPGYILTPMVHVLLEDYPRRKENWPKDNMLGRFSTPDEYRGVAVFLLSNASSFMTGSDLLIDGGHHAW